MDAARLRYELEAEHNMGTSLTLHGNPLDTLDHVNMGQGLCGLCNQPRRKKRHEGRHDPDHRLRLDHGAARESTTRWLNRSPSGGRPLSNRPSPGLPAAAVFRATLDVSNTIPAGLPVAWTEDEALAAIKRGPEVPPPTRGEGRKVPRGQDGPAAAPLNRVLGVRHDLRAWFRECLARHGELLDQRAKRASPSARPSGNSRCARAPRRATFTASSSSRRRWCARRASAHQRQLAGGRALRPTGAGLVEGAVCGRTAAEGLVEVRPNLLRYVIDNVNIYVQSAGRALAALRKPCPAAGARARGAARSWRVRATRASGP